MASILQHVRVAILLPGPVPGAAFLYHPVPGPVPAAAILSHPVPVPVPATAILYLFLYLLEPTCTNLSLGPVHGPVPDACFYLLMTHPATVMVAVDVARAYAVTPTPLQLIC